MEKNDLVVTLLQSNSITLYYKREFLDKDVLLLKENGFQITVFNCSSWSNSEEFYYDFALEMDFPKYFGKNLDAFDECMGEIFHKNGKERVLVFLNFDKFLKTNEKISLNILDIFKKRSRNALVNGSKLITLLQTDDPAIDIKGVKWNSDERSFEKREAVPGKVKFYDLKKLNNSL